MFTLLLDDETAARLQALASQQNRTPNDVVRDLLGQVDAPVVDGNPDDWLKRIAARASQHTDIVWNDETDITEHSREILSTELVDYLFNRIEQNDK